MRNQRKSGLEMLVETEVELVSEMECSFEELALRNRWPAFGFRKMQMWAGWAR